KWKGITLIVDFPEKLIPAGEEGSSSNDERMNLVTFLKWAAAPELAQLDVGVILVTESADELSARLLQNPSVAQVRIDLPDPDDRREPGSGGHPCRCQTKIARTRLAFQKRQDRRHRTRRPRPGPCRRR